MKNDGKKAKKNSNKIVLRGSDPEKIAEQILKETNNVLPTDIEVEIDLNQTKRKK